MCTYADAAVAAGALLSSAAAFACIAFCSSPLTHPSISEGMPTLSPDSTRFQAALSLRSGRLSIYVWNLDSVYQTTVNARKDC